MQPGDFVFSLDEATSLLKLWEIKGVFLGAEGQESLVQLQSLMDRPGEWGEAVGKVKRTLVPEMLVRGRVINRERFMAALIGSKE